MSAAVSSRRNFTFLLASAFMLVIANGVVLVTTANARAVQSGDSVSAPVVETGSKGIQLAESASQDTKKKKKKKKKRRGSYSGN